MKSDMMVQTIVRHDEVIKFILFSESGRHTPIYAVFPVLFLCARHIRVYVKPKRCQNFKRLQEIIISIFNVV